MFNLLNNEHFYNNPDHKKNSNVSFMNYFQNILKNPKKYHIFEVYNEIRLLIPIFFIISNRVM
jgi:hypothetical protein